MLTHKIKKITEIVQTIFSDHDILKLEVNYTETQEKLLNTWKLNHPLTTQQPVGQRGNQKVP